MKHQQSVRCHLHATLVEIKRVRSYAVQVTKEEFTENDIIHEATLYRLTTIGRLIRQISSDLNTTNQKIHWVTSFDYHTLLTSYWTVDLGQVYTLIAETNELSHLEQQITTLIQSNSAGKTPL